MDQRANVEFESDGVTCRAWHYNPICNALADHAGTPCVVMASGFGATRQMGLEPYAQRFAAAGLHVLSFDYRHFGASDGEPRHLISVRRQLHDWQQAVRYARILPGVDPERIALWGTSFSAGHVLATAIRDRRIAVVSAQAPSMDGLVVAVNLLRYAGFRQMLRLIWTGWKDRARTLNGALLRVRRARLDSGAAAARLSPSGPPAAVILL